MEKRILEYSDKIYKTFIFIKKHKDAREYLLALHYNRELRYFAENFNVEIPKNSILNKLMPRNISLIIKKLWETDQNKYIIVCDKLIERSRKKPLNNCTLSMLIYILAYLKNIPSYIRDEITDGLKSINNSKKQLEKSWKMEGSNSESIQAFIDLNLLHSEKILDAINLNNSKPLVKELLDLEDFRLYNRQYMMWYYGDLTIYGENGINNLIPGKDEINKGIDYYNCFYTLYHKVYGYLVKGECQKEYPLLEFDLFTMWNLVYTRNFGKKCLKMPREKQINEYTIDLLNKYLEQMKEKFKIEDDINIEKNIDEEKKAGKIRKVTLEKIKDILEQRNIKEDGEYVYYFFQGAKKALE